MTVKQRQHTLLGSGIRWLILDAAACAEPLWYARGAGITTRSLFRASDEELMDNGPWLIALDNQPDLFRICLEKDPLGHACLWADSDLEPGALAKALQSRVYAQMPEGETTRFRWYDPRVLHPYLEDCEPQRRDQFLAPFSQLLYADLNPYFHEQQCLGWRQPDDQPGYTLHTIPCTEAA